MFCMKCGAKMLDDASFCSSCGASMKGPQQPAQSGQAQTQSQGSQSAASVTLLKCPSCGAPLSPKFGEAVVTCEFCGASVSLGSEGWKNVQKHTLLPVRLSEQSQALEKVRELMDRGMFHKHAFEESKIKEANLAVVPYWLVPSSASTTVTFMWGEAGGGNSGFVIGGARSGPVFATGGGGQVINKTAELNENYNFPVVAVRGLKDYQPIDYQFSLQERTLFQLAGLPKGLKVLNGDVGEEEAKAQAKTLVKDLQYKKAHDLHKHHTIEKIETQIEVTEGELLHAPVWRLKLEHKGKEIDVLVDANSGGILSSRGL